MKVQADKHRTEREFQEGDMVFLKLQPYVQSTMANRTHQKLSFRFYGPYKILQRVGRVAYRLELPPGTRIHPVVHVSQLKKQVPAASAVSSDLSSVCTDPLVNLAPIAALDHRTVLRGASAVPQVRIQWEGLPASMATWEDESVFHQAFADFKA